MIPETKMKKKRILVVDDEPQLVESLFARLTDEGYEVLEAYTGERALKLAQAEKPDLILLDIVLPDEDGLAVMKKLKRPIDPETGEASQTRNIPVIILTGHAEKMEEVFNLEKAFAFFTKPFDVHALVQAIKAALEGREAP